MFSLITDTKTSGDYVDKATKDICKSIMQKQFPGLTPHEKQTKPSPLQYFMDRKKGTTRQATLMLQQIYIQTAGLCNSPDNRPAIITIGQAISTMNHNIAHHITALHKQMEAKTTLNLTPGYAIMVEPDTTAQDMERYLNRLTTLELTESQLIVLKKLVQ